MAKPAKIKLSWVENMLDAKESKEESEAEYRSFQEQIIETMVKGDMERDLIRGTSRGDVQIALVAGVTRNIDPVELLDNLPEDVVEKVTKKVIDPKLLEAAVALGEIDEKLIESATTETPKRPYLRVTVK